MQQPKRRILALCASIAAIWSGLNAATAQEVSAPGGYQFLGLRALMREENSIDAIAAIWSGLNAATAQEVSAPGGYQFFVTPYLWLASVHATTLTPLAREPEVNSNVSTIDLRS